MSPVYTEVVGPKCHQDFYGRGFPQDGVVLIGIAPGRDEVKTKQPFTGPSGKVLDAMLEVVGWSRDRVYCTNMICWWKDDPSKEEAANCAPRLRRELQQIKPRLIITLGAIVTEIFTGKKLFESRGAVMWNKEYGCFVMPTYHPAAVLHDDGDKGPNLAMDIFRDFSKIPSILKMPRNDESERAKYEVLDSVDDVQYMLRHLPKLTTGVPVALDVETNSKDIDEIDVIDDRLICLSVSTPVKGETWVIPRHIAESQDAMRSIEWPVDDVRWTFHNGQFDTEVFVGATGVWLPIREDTMLQSYSLDERARYHKLKPLAREYNAAGWWESDRKKARIPIDQLPPEVLYRYNAHDSWNTAKLQPGFEARQRADNVREMYERILIPAANTLNRMQYRGVKVDKQMLGRFVLKWGKEILELEDKVRGLATYYGWEGEINLDSHPQLNKMCYDILGLPVPPHSKDGKRTTDKEALEFWDGMHPFPTELQAFRTLAKAYDTYIVGGDRNMKHDGRAHPKGKLHAQVTGRPAYTDPPLQTIPRPFSENQKFAVLRQLYTAGGPGRCVVEADYSKAEVWMAYYYSRDHQIFDDLCSGDYHRMVASSVYKMTPEQVTDFMRSETKKIVFGVMYGMEEASMAKRTQTTTAEAREFINSFYARNTDYHRWSEGIKQTILDDGELVTITGRKRRFLLTGQRSDYRAFKQGVNFPIQSTSSDVLVTSAVELYPILEALDAYIMVTVHDSIVVDAPVANLEAVLDAMHRVMTAVKFPPHNIYVPIEIKIGRSWGVAKGVHECEKEGCLKAHRAGEIYTPDFSHVRDVLVEKQLVAA